jgi:hypothetical protein
MNDDLERLDKRFDRLDRNLGELGKALAHLEAMLGKIAAADAQRALYAAVPINPSRPNGGMKREAACAARDKPNGGMRHG